MPPLFPIPAIFCSCMSVANYHKLGYFVENFPNIFLEGKKSAWQAFLGGQEGFLEAFFGWTPGWRGFTIQKPEKVEVCKPVKKNIFET